MSFFSNGKRQKFIGKKITFKVIGKQGAFAYLSEQLICDAILKTHFRILRSKLFFPNEIVQV
jgi:hypothetical protein